jgi:hypothetical protein
VSQGRVPLSQTESAKDSGHYLPERALAIKVKNPASQAAPPIVKDRASWSASAQAVTAPPVKQEIHRLRPRPASSNQPTYEGGRYVNSEISV